jgi:hypothetical protein
MRASSAHGIVMFVMFYFVAIFATVVTGLPPGQAGIQLLYFAPGLVRVSPLDVRVLSIVDGSRVVSRDQGVCSRFG